MNMLARAMAVGLELGFAIAIPLVGFLLFGLWLDRRIGTTPLFMIVFLLAGLAVVVIEVKQLILPFLEKRSKKNDKL
ncbi:MAG: AtpZ/AtpI family protein [Candidatus Nealsonbacteria bacterium DGGOD1a]|nr:MAG: AtpZ/AtpI family protein [Candidatus Nealsonbacteria bacterium DGGOD1a]